MFFSQKLAIFLFFTSIPANMSLKCYETKWNDNGQNVGSTLQECEVNQVCHIMKVVYGSKKFQSVQFISFLGSHP